ncbi:MAG: MFS transporter [Myxococcota bacterium]
MTTVSERSNPWRETIGDLRGRALWVVVGCLICQVGLGFNYVLGPLAGDIIAEFGWTRATFSSARAPQLFVIATASPLIGALVVRFGARWILAAGTISLGIAFLLFGRMQNPWEMYGLVMLLGLSVTALGDITTGQLVAHWVVRGRGLALGIVYTGSNLGGWLLVPMAAGIASRETWREAFSGLGIAAFAVLLPVALFVVREPRGTKRPDASLPAAGEPAGEQDMNLSAALRTRSFWILAASLSSFFFYFLGVLDCLVLFLTDVGMPRQQAAQYFGRALGLGILSKITLGLIADRIPHKTAIVLDYALLAASSVLLLMLPDERLIWLFVASFGFSTAARDVVTPLIVAHCFGIRYLAQIYGALMLVLLPGGALGPIFAAAIHDHTQSYAGAFATYAVLNTAAAGALCFVRRER